MAAWLSPGDRVKVFDHLLYRDDVSTPPSVTMCPATVFAIRMDKGREVADIQFDHRPERISRGHFTRFVHRI